jgi:hypothetical protein
MAAAHLSTPFLSMNPRSKVSGKHLPRVAYLYIRPFTWRQDFKNTENTQRQYALRRRGQAPSPS